MTSTLASLTSSQRQSLIDELSRLETLAKDRSNFIRHCSESARLSIESKRSLQLLLECERGHRRRCKNAKRLWTTLGTASPLIPALASFSEMLLRESATLTTVSEPWQRQSLSDERSALTEMWQRLSKSAGYFIAD